MSALGKFSSPYPRPHIFLFDPNNILILLCGIFFVELGAMIGCFFGVLLSSEGPDWTLGVTAGVFLFSLQCHFFHLSLFDVLAIF